MNGKLRVILPFFLCCFFLSLLVVFRVQTVNPLWNGWRVLAVDAQVSEQHVLAALQNAGVKTVVSVSSKKAADFPNYTIESVYSTQFSPMLKTENNNYVTSLDAYFYDSARSWRLYYLLNNPISLKKAQEAMTSVGGRWGIDEQSVPSTVPSLVCVLITLVLLYFAKKSLVFLCAQLPFLLLAFLSSSAAVCAAVCFTAFIAFCVQLVWGKPHFLLLLKKNVFFLFISILCSVLVFADGWFFFLLFVCALCASVSALYACNQITLRLNALRRFNPVLMMPARRQDFSGKRLFRVFIATAIAALCVLPVFALFARFLPSSGIAGLSIPAPVQYTKSADFDMIGYSEVKNLKTQKSLPGLDDYVLFCWHSAVFPFVRLYDGSRNPQPGDRVEFPRYKKAQDGKISVSGEEAFVFDQAFLGRLLGTIDKMETPAIETVFRSQEGFFAAGYTGTVKTASRSHGSLPISVIVIVLVLIFAGFFLYKADRWLK